MLLRALPLLLPLCPRLGRFVVAVGALAVFMVAGYLSRCLSREDTFDEQCTLYFGCTKEIGSTEKLGFLNNWKCSNQRTLRGQCFVLSMASESKAIVVTF